VTPRLYVQDLPLAQLALTDTAVALPDGPARHVQVLRLQPGDALALFDGRGDEWLATVVSMGRKEVTVQVGPLQATDRELRTQVTLAVGMPANDRMDALVEKATELGVAAIQPLVCARSVLRLDGERAAKKVAHWQSVAVAASEQSGRTRVPVIHPVTTLKAWLPSGGANGARGDAPHSRGVLSFEPQAQVAQWLPQLPAASPLVFLSGPEGGLSPEELQQALQAGWTPVGLGPRVLRADTAPLMALSLVAGLSLG
jgi:16S rRNA (uracil1498-N3)-methyltransferase